MSKECVYGFGTTVTTGYDKTINLIEGLLDERGFKIYTRLDVHDIGGECLCEGISRYVILGACNPGYAKVLFNADPNIGLLMPCNVVIYEKLDKTCKVMIKDPLRIMDLIDNPYAIQASIEIKEHLEQIIEVLENAR